jgi:hypothetical protein
VVEGSHLSKTSHLSPTTSRDNTNDTIVHVLQNLIGRKPHCPKTSRSQDPIALVVPARLITAIMRFAVDLDSQTRRQAGKIQRVRRLGKLPAKFEATRVLAQFSPQEDFRKTHGFAQVTGALHLLDWLIEDRWAPSTTLRPRAR